MTNIYFSDFSLALQVIDSEHLKTRLLVHDGWILLLDKLIFESLVPKWTSWNFRTISILIYIYKLLEQVKFRSTHTEGQLNVNS